MNAYQRELLDKLITELLTEPTHSPLLAKFQMLAAELKGAMGQSESEQSPQAAPQPDADGWVENTTGRKPNCGIAAMKFAQNCITSNDTVDIKWGTMHNNGYAITHYRPA